jgi:hypothetical protein
MLQKLKCSTTSATYDMRLSKNRLPGGAIDKLILINNKRFKICMR